MLPTWAIWRARGLLRTRPTDICPFFALLLFLRCRHPRARALGVQLGGPQTRTQSTDVVAGSGVVPGMKSFVPIPRAWVKQM
jgi:hypothetical protein